MRGEKRGDDGEMPALVKRSRIGALAGVSLLGIAAIGGFVAGLNARVGLDGVGASASLPSDLSASDAVGLRFPNDWADAPPAMPMTFALASTDPGVALFDPAPLYPLGPDSTASVSLDPPTPNAQPAAAAPSKAVVTPRSTHRSNAVLNEAQLASIKRRLNLTREQERYWPAVEAELRKLEYKKDPKSPQATHTAGVDTTRVNVEGLKSAGFPLIMSFNDDQRQELKSLAHLLGLENVIANF